MYGCGALVRSKNECNDLEVKHNEMRRWLWLVVNVKNELIRGDTGWSTFEEREEKIKLVGRRIWMNKCGNSDILQE